MPAAQSRGIQFLAEGRGGRRIFDDHPVHDQFLLAYVRPLEIGDRDAPVSSALDRLEDFRPLKGVGVSLALQPAFRGVDAVGNVDCKHERQVDRRGGRARRARQNEQGDDQTEYDEAPSAV